jgi:uncharacterized protein (DUF305 family)
MNTSRTAQASPSWFGAGGMLLAFVLGLVLGRALELQPNEGSPEVVFARDMIAHHEQAVEMALILRDRTPDSTLRDYALDIILTQQGQVGQMQGWLSSYGVPLVGVNPPMQGQGELMGMAKRAIVNTLRTMSVPQLEVRFLQLMITHHEGGVMMARDVLERTGRPEVRRLAQSVVDGQSSEIRFMEGLLKARGGTRPEPLPPMNHSKTR